MFRDASFPRELAYGAEGGPEWATDVFTSVSGYEKRRGHFLQNRGRWTVSLLHRTGPEIASLLHFFRCVAVGKAYSFRFRDFTDDQFANVIGTGDGVQTQFQLFKQYRLGNQFYNRILTKPVVTTVRVTVNGVSTTGFSIDAFTGMLALTPAPPSGAQLAARGEFDCVVRFETDTLRLTAVDPGPGGILVFDATEITLVECLNEELEPAQLDVSIMEPWEAPQEYEAPTIVFREHWES